MTETAEPTGECRVKDGKRGLIGPVSLETIRDLLTAGVIAPDALVSRGDGPFEPIAGIKEFEKDLECGRLPQPTMRGELGEKSILPFIYRLFRTKETGLLVVEDDHLRKDVYFRNGSLVFLSSNIPTERFGGFLVLHKKLEKEQLNEALEVMKKEDQRLGEILVSLGFLKEKQLFTELRRHQLGRMLELCCWRSGQYFFHRDRQYSGDDPNLRVGIPKLIMTVGREMTEEMILPHLEPHFSTTLEISGDINHKALSLFPEEQEIVDAIDGKRSCGELIAQLTSGGIERQTVLMMIYILAELGSIQF